MAKMGRPVNPQAVLQTDDGFRRISIGKTTYDNLKRLANKEGTSMAALVKQWVAQATGDDTQAVLIQHKATVGDLAGPVEQLSDISLKVLTLCVALNRVLGLRTDIILGEKVEIDKVGEIVDAELARRLTAPVVSQLTLETT